MKKIFLIGAVLILASKLLLTTNMRCLMSSKDCPLGICKPDKFPKLGNTGK
jgi:hypothetical protein